jgi:DNA-binding transcriptional ArsR family regulator
MAFEAVTQNLAEACNLLDAMGNPARLEILSILAQEEISVGNLATKMGLSQSALSQHLSKLRSQDLVGTRRDAQTIFYVCKNPAVLRVLGELAVLFDDEDAARQKAT